jgi:hypothetical protein
VPTTGQTARPSGAFYWADERTIPHGTVFPWLPSLPLKQGNNVQFKSDSLACLHALFIASSFTYVASVPSDDGVHHERAYPSQHKRARNIIRSD